MAASSTPPAQGATISPSPAADATVFAGGRSSASQKVLLVGGRPSARAYLRWQLPASLDGLERATLRLYTPTGGRGLRIHTGRDSWSERSIRGKKPRASQLAGSVALARPRSWIQLDVTRFVRSGGSVSFVVSKAGAQARLASREGTAAFRPRLLLLVNGAPTCADGTASTSEDSALAARFACSDDGALSYRQTAAPAHGTLALSGDGSYRYVPSTNFHGADEFGYEACDSGRPSRCAGGRLRIQVSSVNDAPTAVPLSVTTAEDTPAQLSFGGSDADGDPLSFSIASQPGHGAVAGATYTPAQNYAGPDSFVYLVSDGKGGTAGATATLNVTPVNDAPVAANNAYTVAEDATLNVAAPGVLGNDTDVEGSALTATQVLGTSNGLLALNPDGSFSYTPGANYNGADSFTYKANDGSLDSNIATVTITVTEVNDAPIAGDDTKATAEDAPLTFPAAVLLANDAKGPANESGQTLTVTSVQNAVNGTVSLAAGNVTFTPNANSNGSASFQYTVRDDGTTNGVADPRSASGVVNVTVAPVNDAPVAVADSYSTAEGTALTVAAPGVLANDTDIDTAAAGLSSVKVMDPSSGAVTLNGNGSFTYTPTSGFNGLDSFTYKTNDGALDSNTVGVTIEVGAVNDAPVAQSQNVTAVEDIAKAITLVATDVDSGSLTYSVVAGPSNGTLSGAPPNVSYTPASNYNGPDSFTFKANDGSLDSNVATVSITVTEVNDNPTSVADNKSVAEDGTLTFPASDLVANDSKGPANESGQTLTVTSVQGPINGAVTLLGGTVTFTPNADYNGPASFGYTVADNGTTNGAADPKTANGVVNVTVTEVNDTPTAAADTRVTAEDTALTFPASDLAANDSKGASNESGQTLSVISVQGPANGTVGLVSGNVTFTPASNFNGTASFTYTIRDDGTTDGVADPKTATGTVVVSVASVNDAPVLNIAGTSVMTPVAEDTISPAGDSVPAIIATGAGADPISDFDAGALEGIAVISAGGLGAWQYSVNDGATWSALGSVGNNNARLLAADPKNRLRFVPNANVNGNASFTYRAWDQTSGTDGGTANTGQNGGTRAFSAQIEEVTITVTAVNDAPVCQTRVLEVDEDGAGAVAPSCSDAEGASLTYTIASDPSKGSAILAAGQLQYVAQANATGADSFTYAASDGTTTGAPAVVNVTIRPVNDAPEAFPQDLSTPEDASKTVTLEGFDEEGDALTFTIESLPANGQLFAGTGTTGYLIAPADLPYALAGNKVTYRPAAGFSGRDGFLFTAYDGTDASVSSEIAITVVGVNVAPECTSMSLTVLEGGEIWDRVCSDADGDQLTFTRSGPSHGTLDLFDDGTFNYVPNADYDGPDSFTVTATDPSGAASAAATVSITVTPTNNAPICRPVFLTTPEDTAGTTLPDCEDPEGVALTYSIVGQGTKGTASVTAGGALSYQPNQNDNGSDTFTYAATDGAATSAPATVSVQITSVNDSPVCRPVTILTSEDVLGSTFPDCEDADGDVLTYSTAAASQGTASFSADKLRYTPNANFNGADEFTYRAYDGAAFSAAARAAVTVAPVNDAPALDASGSPQLSPVNANASDPAGDTVAAILATGVGGDPITDADPSDPDGIAVVAVNAAGGTWQYDPTGSAGWSSLNGASQAAARLLAPGAKIRFLPAAGFTGSASIDFRAWDQTQGVGGGTADTSANGGTSAFSTVFETAAIDVTPPVNRPPVAVDNVAATDEDTPIDVNVLANDSDPDGDALAVVSLTTADDGIVTVNADGTVRYQPDPDTNGTDRFVYTVEDGRGGSATAEVDVTVQAVNDLPIARDDVERVSEDGMVVFDPTVNDVAGPLDESGRPITISGVTGPPANGTAELPVTGPDAGKVRYVPNPGYEGTDRFQYEICDDGTPAFCSEATVDMTVSRVSATVETAPVSANAFTTDAADDPAIWVHPTDSAQSVVIATNKFSQTGGTNGGLLVYDLQGNELQYTNDGRMNNVDLRDGFPLGGQEVTIVTSTERNGGNLAISPKRIWVYKLDPATRTLAPIHRAAPIVAGFEPYGTCMYRSPLTSEFFVFVVGKNGDVEQWRLFETAGAVDATRVRTFTVPDSSPVAEDVTEACVADDELGQLYIAEEDAGILKYPAEADGGTTGTRVDVVGDGHMVADVEGLAIAQGPGGTGYLIASSQGDSSYAVYRRKGGNEFVRRLKIKAGAVDGASATDGIDVTTASLGPAFPNGVFVAQDNANPEANQNYKLVPLEELVETGGLGSNGSCARPYADSSPWNAPIDAAAAVHPDSAAHVAAITGQLRSDPSQYTYPVYVAEPGTPLETVAIDGWYSNVTNGGRTLVNQREGTMQIPIPAGAIAAAGGDAQLIVVDPRTGDEWGVSHAKQDATGAWSAWNGYHYNTRWSAVPPYDATGKPFFPRGAGVTYLAGLVRPCELERGRIDHALAFAYDFPTGDFIYPATKSDGNSAGFPDMPEGSRLRLDPSLSAADLANLRCTGHCLTIARALQKYGMYIIDNSGRPKVMLEYEGTAAWGGTVTSSTVSPIPLSAFKLLER